ncbi:MAG: hypothetical protein ACT6FG_00170 [Methanosarcinaceae archaeon]
MNRGSLTYTSERLKRMLKEDGLEDSFDDLVFSGVEYDFEHNIIIFYGYSNSDKFKPVNECSIPDTVHL